MCILKALTVSPFPYHIKTVDPTTADSATADPTTADPTTADSTTADPTTVDPTTEIFGLCSHK